MGKLTDDFERRNKITFSVREEYKDIVKVFKKNIEKDSRLQVLRPSKKIGIFSIALCQLMAKYNKDNRSNLEKETEEDAEDG